MRCDRQGRPDPNGDFELRGDKICVRDGARVGFELMFMDSTPTSGGATLTEAERDFAVAQAKVKHDLRHAHRPPEQRPPFGAEQRQQAIKQAAETKQASAQHQQALSLSGEAGRLRSEAEGERLARKHLVANAWRR